MNRPVVVGAVVLVVLLLLLGAGVAWCPPTQSEQLAAWAQAFGTVFAIAGSAYVVHLQSQIEKDRDAELEAGMGQMALDIVEELVRYVESALRPVRPEGSLGGKPKKLDVAGVERASEELRVISTRDFSRARVRLALRKLQACADTYADAALEVFQDPARKIYPELANPEGSDALVKARGRLDTARIEFERARAS